VPSPIEPALEPRAFRDVLGLFATGIAIIVAECANEIRAMTANAVSSVSLDPMLMLFCPGKHSKLAQHLPHMKCFTINFLRSEQQALSTYFAGGWKEQAVPPFRFVPWIGAPRLEGSLAALSCETQQVIDAGDHWLVIGRVIGLHRGIDPLRPLLFFRGSYRQIDFFESSPAPDLAAVDEPPHVFYDSGAR
jgi:flavin reductase (DIM6/NTAB) family NADH-FMN oxidoreductase RutF